MANTRMLSGVAKESADDNDDLFGGETLGAGCKPMR